MPIVLVLVAWLAVGCGEPSAYPDLDFDTTEMGVVSLPEAAPRPRIAIAEAIAVVQREYPQGPIQVVQVGRRWALAANGPAWVVVYVVPGEARQNGFVIDDQTGTVIVTFTPDQLRRSQATPSG